MKTQKSFAILAILAFAALSCSKEETAPQAESEEPIVHEGIAFNAVLEQPTRATLDGYTVKWEEGDQIAVHNGTTWAVSDPLQSSDITGGGVNATFYVSIDAAATYYAVYPATAAPASAPEGDNISITLPAVQTIPADHKIAKEALVQVSKSASSALSFKNAVSLVEFKVPESGISSVYFEASQSGSPLNIVGTGTVDAGTPGTVTGNAERVIVNSASTFTSGQNYLAAIYPQAAVVDGFRFTFTKVSVANGAQKAFRTGSLTSAIEFPVNGGKKVTDFDGDLSWVGPISDKAELDKWASHASYWQVGETLLLDADIDYGGATWTPVSGRYDSGFAGAIDGQNHSIYNIVMTVSAANTGFFDFLTCDSQVVRVKDIKFGYNPSTMAADGTSAMTLSTTIANAKLGVVSSNANNAIISGVSNYIPITVTGSSTGVQIGGLVGRTGDNVTLQNCKNYAGIQFNSEGKECYLGGLVGVLAGLDCILSGCHNYGAVQRIKAGATKGNQFIGGIVGRTGVDCSGIIIEDCHNHGTVGTTKNIKANQLYIGGILGMDNVGIGSDFNVSIISSSNAADGVVSCYNQSSVGENGIGGILGCAKNKSLIDGCNNHGSVIKLGNFNSVNGRFGGIVGYLLNNGDNVATVRNCNNGSSGDTSYGAITDEDQTTVSAKFVQIGGIIGYQVAGTVDNCKNYGKIWLKGTTASCNEYAGGIVGDFAGGAITNCESRGPIVVAGTTVSYSAGGVVGTLSATSAVSTATGCTVASAVSCGYAANAGLVVGLYTSTGTTVMGSSVSPISIVNSSTVNGNAITTDPGDTYYFGKCLAGSAAGITESGTPNGNNNIWGSYSAL